MPTNNYRIRVAADSVDVECDTPFRSRTAQYSWGGYAIACSLFMLYFVGFGHGRNSGYLRILAHSRPGSAEFTSNVFGAVFILVTVIIILSFGVRYSLPFGERLHCDSDTLTWSKIPWLSFGNRWVTRTVPLPEILGASYAIVYKSKGVYGILLETYGEPWKMFWGIEAPEANRILRGLKALGVNVHRDPEMREVIRETLRDRRAQL
ncbi:MAG: hypothetical protein ABSG51_07805 [Terracidiphilus sp.]|jgi:hypothetical protein